MVGHRKKKRENQNAGNSAYGIFAVLVEYYTNFIALDTADKYPFDVVKLESENTHSQSIDNNKKLFSKWENSETEKGSKTTEKWSMESSEVNSGHIKIEMMNANRKMDISE